MFEFKLLQATQIVEKTMAYTIYRLSLYLALSLGFVFATILGTGTQLMVGSFSRTPDSVGAVGGIVGFMLFGIVLYLFRGHWLYAVKAPHIVLLNDSMDESIVQQGWGQVRNAKQRVRNQYPNAAVMHRLNESIKDVLTDLFDSQTNIGKALPDFGDLPFSKLLNRVCSLPVTYTSEVIFASCFKKSSDLGASTVASSLLLYAQNFSALWRSAWVLFILNNVGWLCIFLLVQTPIAWLAEFLPVTLGGWETIFSLVLAWPIKAALFEPIGICAMMALFNQLTHNQTVDSAWEEKLAGLSDSFQTIQKKAISEQEQQIIKEGDQEKPAQ